MRKEFSTIESKLLSLKRICLTGLLLFSFATVQNLHAQSCPLACDDNVQVSVDEDCIALITPDMILEDPGVLCNYIVVVYDNNGLPLPDATVRRRHIGKTLNVSVFLGTNSCWGTIKVEDKLPPVVDCPLPDTVFCNDRNYLLEVPGVRDNCGGATRRVNISDDIIKYPCDSLLAGKRTIRYYFTDSTGNRSDTCEQCVYFRKITFPEIDYPLDTTVDCEWYDTIPPLSVTGVPTMGGDPIYPDWSICKFAVTYEDQIIPVCPKTFKVLRKWTVIDWCIPTTRQGGNIDTYIQIIKVIDDKAPITVVMNNLTISTDAGSCTGTAIFGPPFLIEECSDTTIELGYKILISPGDTLSSEGLSDDNITYLPNGLYSISELPAGIIWVVFTVIDECGNETENPFEIFVEDMVPPVAVCDQRTVVSLTIDGTAKVSALTFDDRSFDNCLLDRMEVRRMDRGIPCDTARRDDWGPFAFFCCNDIGKTILVNFRVIDTAGNSNTCMVEVEVQDKIAPLCVPPPNITVSCEFDYPDLTVFGFVRDDISKRQPIVINDKYVKFSGPKIDGYAFDGCGVIIREFPKDSLSCGRGKITRRFEVTDRFGLKSTCTQMITVVDSILNNIIVDFPDDYFSSTICATPLDLKPSVTGEPIILGKDQCSNIAINYTDLVFTFDPDACLKILRKWTVIDWCIYRPNDQIPKGYWVWTQVIKINNTVPPIIRSSCLDRVIDVFGPGCQGFVNLIASADDDCTDSADLVWEHTVDLFNNGKLDSFERKLNGPGPDASGIYPVGKHKVCFTVRDACGNERKCCFILTVRDGKKPTPYCLSSITTVIMPSTKSLEIWAKDFNLNSEDNCTPKDSLKYAFLINGVFVPNMVLDCSFKGMTRFRIYVIDQAGNFDYCETTLDLQDPNKVCPTGLSVQGDLQTAENKPLKNAKVIWDRLQPFSSNSTITDENGVFSFNNLTLNANYEIRAEKNDDHLNGITTQDIVFIQKHILGQTPLASPYKLIAADANNNGVITAADISEIRKIILGIQTEFSKNQSWRFVPKTYVFQNPSNPFPFLEKISYNYISQNHLNANFYAIKIGDISGNAVTNQLHKSGSRSRHTIPMTVDHQLFNANQEVRIPVSIQADFLMSGFQLSLEYNETALEWIGMDCGLIDFTESNLNVRENKIRISYTSTQDLSIRNGQVLFTMVFRAKNNGSVKYAINLSKNELDAEIYNQKADVTDLKLGFRNSAGIEEDALSYVLYQNRPNPFNESTLVGFEIPKAQQVHFIIYEMDGRVVKKTDQWYEEGYHEISLNKTDLTGAGVYYIQMNTNEFTETKKMVLIR
ncbi:MAG: T9SS type A sorting domain-containing protein [Bacteroidota bacterium]|nr:T9SS type A sorting domain-containing protein [Bacteroidota bacterium]